MHRTGVRSTATPTVAGEHARFARPSSALHVVGGIRPGTTNRLLRALATSSRSGILTATHQQGEIELAVRSGELVYGRQSPGGLSVGEAALDHGHISQGDLLLALRRQRTLTPERPLGTLLLEVGAISEPGLRNVLLAQATGAVRELLRWQRGFYRFTSAEIYTTAWMGVGARLADVMGEALGGDEDAGSQPALSGTARVGPIELFRSADEGMRDALERLFFFAQRTFEFSLLAMLEGERYFVVGGHGGAVADPNRTIARRGAGTIFDRVAERRETIEVFSSDSESLPMLAMLRNRCPLHAMAFPVLVEGDVAGVLYCDSSNERPLAHVGLLETVVRETGVALERRLWQVRVGRLEDQLRQLRVERERLRQRYERLRGSAFDWGLMT